MAKSNVGPNALGPGTRASSKHWANYLCHPPWSGKEQRASDAENLFFEWLMGGRKRRQEWMMTLRKRSKHFANYLYQSDPMGRGKEQRASDAEDLFFEWFMGGP